MTTGRIKGTQTFDQTEQGRIFSGMDVYAEYLDEKGRIRELTFHYSYHTNDLRGHVERVLHYMASSKPMPTEYTKVEMS